MSAVALDINAPDFAFAADYLNGISGRINVNDFELEAAVIIESQTKRRISEDKTGPDGDPWRDWSASYAQTRHSGHSLLQGNNSLLTSIAFDQQGGQTLVGSDLPYAAIHQFGGEAGRNKAVTIAARPYLGLSDDDQRELEDILSDYIQGVLQ